MVEEKEGQKGHIKTLELGTKFKVDGTGSVTLESGYCEERIERGRGADISFEEKTISQLIRRLSWGKSAIGPFTVRRTGLNNLY